jgi:hypothetical protein
MNGYKMAETNPRLSPAVATASVIAVGDLIWRDTAASDTPKAAADKAWDTSLAVTQEAFHDVFLGVALQRSRSGDITPIRYATSGIFEFDCASASFKEGDLVGPAKQTGNAIESQKVVAVATPNLAIGRVAVSGTSLTKVKVAIDAVLATGGPRAMA